MSLPRPFPLAVCCAAACLLTPIGDAAGGQAGASARRLAQNRFVAQKRSSSRRGRSTSKKPSGPPKSNFKAAGAIKRIRPGLLDIVTGESEEWLIRVDAKPQDIHFIGEADLGWLRSGMFVRIVGPFNKRGQPQAAIDKVEVFTPRPKTRIGVFPEAPPIDLEAAPEAVAAPASDDALDASVRSYQVVGRLTDLKRGWITMAAGRTVVKAPLADQVVVSFDIADCRFARAGDKVEVEGFYYPIQPRCGYATKLTITADKPLTSGGAPKKGREETQPAGGARAVAQEPGGSPP